MYYEAKINTPLGEQITEFRKRIKETKTIIQKWIRKQNNDFGGKYLINHGYLAGAIIAIQFEHPPRQWCKMKHYDGYYRPRARHEKLNKEIKNLPSIKQNELNQLFGLKRKIYGLKEFRCVGIKMVGTAYVISVPDFVDDFKPPTDMDFLSVKTYLKLREQHHDSTTTCHHPVPPRRSKEKIPNRQPIQSVALP